MRFLLHPWIVIAAALAASGCAVCASPDDEAYSSYGGIVERHDPYHGRVGSAFAPPGEIHLASASEEVLDSQTEEIEQGEPTPADAAPLDRQREGTEPSPLTQPESAPPASDDRNEQPEAGSPAAPSPPSGGAPPAELPPPADLPSEDEPSPMTPSAPEVFFE